MNQRSQDINKNNDRDLVELGKWLTEMGINWEGDISKIEVLNLARKALTTLPESIGLLTNLQKLYLTDNQLTSLPESIGQLTNLQALCLDSNQLTSLPESIRRLTNLQKLYLNSNQLTSLPESIGQLTNLQALGLDSNQLTSLPESIGQLTNLQKLDLNGNQLTDLSPLKRLINLHCNYFGFDFGFYLPCRYRTKFSDWQPEWLLDEENVEARRILIQQLGYEEICVRLGANAIDTWREYTLLKIYHSQPVYQFVYKDEYIFDYYENDSDMPIYWEPMVLLKMTCPSTNHIHILRVPPEMTSAEAAITWVNHGIHPDLIAFQT